ncbi:hypothetical protein GOP47_0028979 [Adiantum capillus-veneris]|nr:hypothetical protein GOP47_0028979 [Adiantum capillus-veneris]
MKFPLLRAFLKDLYTTMLDHVGKERQPNLDNIVYNTIKDKLGDSIASPKKACGLNKKEHKFLMGDKSSSGKKHNGGNKMTVLKKALKSTDKQLISFMDNVEARRSKHDYEVIELTKTEFEEAVAINQEHLVLEEESNGALKQISNAFKCFAMYASKAQLLENSFKNSYLEL